MAKLRKKPRRNPGPAQTGQAQDQRAPRGQSQGDRESAGQERRTATFTFSHHREEDFDQGLRPYSAYRDLGIAPATGGMVQAHVIRMTKPFTDEEVAIPHITTSSSRWSTCSRAGSRPNSRAKACTRSTPARCWIQPPEIKHTVRGYSDDCELLGDRAAGGFRDGDAGVTGGRTVLL